MYLQRFQGDAILIHFYFLNLSGENVSRDTNDASDEFPITFRTCNFGGTNTSLPYFEIEILSIIMHAHFLN